MTNKQTLIIIIPCYNEEKRLPVEEFSLFLRDERSKHIHIKLVNDGSKDNTLSKLVQLSDQFTNVSVLDLEKNIGKAEAIRAGVNSVLKEECNYIGYFDADLATPLNELFRMSDLIEEKNKPYMLVGSRVKLLGLTKIKRKLRRHYIGRIFATVVSNMLKLPIYDTQCGAKLIMKEVCQDLFKDPFVSKWLFDVELFFRLKKVKPDYNKHIVEMPLMKWEDKAGSKIGLLYYLQAPFDLLRIFLKYH